MRRGLVLLILLPLFVPVIRDASAQGRGGGSWATTNGDAQRTSWGRTDAKVAAETLQRSGFRLLWKMKLDNQPKQLNSLTQPLTLPNIISYKGFKALAFVGGSSDNVYAIDYDLSKIFWTRHLETATSSTSTSLSCPGGLTAMTRSAPFAIPGPAGAADGRGGPPAGGPPPQAGRGGGGGGGGGNNNAPIGNAIYVISSGGALHLLNPQTGTDLKPAINILPANSKIVGSMFADNVFYAATTDGCGGAENGITAVDLAADPKKTTWTTGGAVIAGSVGPAFGGDGTIFVATGEGSGNNANSIVALEAKTLKPKDSFSTTTPFTSSPVFFEFKGKDLLVAANKDGKLYMFDAKSLGGSDHKTALFKSSAFTSTTSDFSPGALATWEDSTGNRWILAPSASAIVAFKVIDQGGTPILQQGWTSRELTSPMAWDPLESTCRHASLSIL